MRRLGHLIVVTLLAGCGADQAGQAPTDAGVVANGTVLTPEEVAEGWTLLFDGVSTAGWRGYNRADFPTEGWGVEGGDLVVYPGGIGGDIVTEAVFSSFELSFEFKVSPVGNSGVFYLVEEHPNTVIWQVAPEFQVLDDPTYIERGLSEGHLTGDNYDLHASVVRSAKPVGEWNHGRVVVDGTSVEHWLNGERTVAYELRSPEWERRVAESKFAPHEHYGRASAGRIGLQDHDHEVRYRNLKIRPLAAVGGLR